MRLRGGVAPAAQFDAPAQRLPVVIILVIDMLPGMSFHAAHARYPHGH
ncbi:hypothetical protein Q3A80_28815 [Burkholderia sp. SR8]|jgi:hypothetical protein